MPTYTITDPRSHRTVTLTGDSPPSEAELDGIFAQVQAGIPNPARGFPGETASLGAGPSSLARQTQLARTDLPPDVRAELERGAGGQDHFAALATRQGLGAVASGLLAPVKAWSAAGPQRVVTGLREMYGGRYAKGANDALIGAGITAAPVFAPEAIPAMIAAPGATALTLAGSAAAQAAMPRIASAFGATPDQAELAGTLGGAAAGTAIVKRGIPALTKWSLNTKAVTMGKDYMKSTRDIQAALGVSAEDVHRARPFLETVHANGIPIAGKDEAASQLVRAANVAVDEIEQHVAGLVRQFPTATAPPMHGAILKRVASMPGVVSSDLTAAKQVIQEYGLNRPRSLAEAESLRVRLNAENRSVLEGSGVKQRTAVMTNPTFVARQEAANQLREGIYGALEHRGVSGIRDLRQSEGSILKLRSAADPVTRGLRGEMRVARTGERGMVRRMAQHALRAGGAALGAGVAGPFGAGVGSEVGQTLGGGWTQANLSRNELLDRAFRQSFTSPPIMSTQGFRAPNSTPGALVRVIPSGMRLTNGR